MIKQLKIEKVGTPNPDNSNIGRHILGFEAGTIDIWFGGFFDFKTAEEALEYAELMIERMSTPTDSAEALSDEELENLMQPIKGDND